MARVTLRLPAGLHRRLRATSRRRGVSQNQLIVVALTDAIAREAPADRRADPLREQVQHIRTVLGDLIVDLEVSPPGRKTREGAARPARRTRRPALPVLTPPLSDTVIREREDRL